MDAAWAWLRADLKERDGSAKWSFVVDGFGADPVDVSEGIYFSTSRTELNELNEY